MQVPQSDLSYLSSNGYLSVMQKSDYDQAAADVATIAQRTQALQDETMQEHGAEISLADDQRKTQSIMFHFEGAEKKQADLAALEAERNAVLRQRADMVQKDADIKQLIVKKSILDRMVPYDGQYLALTGPGVMALSDLNVRNYRVSDEDFSSFVQETRETTDELRSIAQSAKADVTSFTNAIPEADPSQLWSVAIGLAKLQGDQYQIGTRFLVALNVLRHSDSNIDNKMMAAEIMTSMRTDQSAFNSDLENLSASLQSLEHNVRHHAHVPKQISAGVAATILFGKRFDGSYPIDKFQQFSKITKSFESAAILSVINVPSDQLLAKFQAFRQMFGLWGYQTTEDTELASAYLAISDFVPDDVRTKMTIILSSLRNYLEYPLVAASILTSIPTLEANETLDLMEKTYSTLWSFATGLERSELVSLSVRMIHGIKNELVQKLDPTARIANTPVQFRTSPMFVFLPYRMPLILAHSSYYSTFSGIGGVHPAHVHGYGGGGGFGG